MKDVSRRTAAARLAVGLSLGLNLFFAGWMLTQAIVPQDKPSYQVPAPRPEVVADAIATALPKADGDLLRQAVAQKRDALNEARRQYIAAFDRVRAVIVSDPVDPEVLRESVLQLRTVHQAERALFGDTIIGVIPAMSREGRQAFVATHMGGKP